MIKCKCGRIFKIEQHYNMHLKYCNGPKYCQNLECKKLLNENQKLFCSSKCSAIVNTKGRQHSTETKIKISISLGGKGEINKPYCLNCEKPISSNNKYCDLNCFIDYKYKQNVIKWLSNPEKYTSPKAFMKRWLIEQKGEKCHRCGWDKLNTYTGKKPLEMHHKDGNWRNNYPENLDLVCPNCHSLTSTYRYGNRGNGREWAKNYYRGKTTKKDLPVVQLDVTSDF